MSADGRPVRTGALPQRSSARMSGSAAFQRAKALLAAWFGLTPGEAENLLLTWSCENKMSACELAIALVGDIHEGRPSGCSTAVVRYLEARLREVAPGPASARKRTESGDRRAVEAGTGPLPDLDGDPGWSVPDPRAAPDRGPDLDPNPDLPDRPDAARLPDGQA